MFCVRIQTDATERIEAYVHGSDMSALTGKTDILISIRRTSDGYWYDFDDDTFKTSGWTERREQMTETDSTNAPGTYHYDFDTSAITNETANDTYMIRVEQSPGSDAVNVPQYGEIKVGQYVDYIDDAISDKAEPGDAMDLVNDAVDSGSVASSGANEIRDAILADSTPFNGADVGDIKTETDKIQTVDDNVDSIVAKLPTNYIMGSSDQSDKDDEIDAIKDVTDNLPNGGALTDIDTGVNNIEAKLPTNYIMGSSDQADHDGEIGDILADTEVMEPRIDQSLSTTESNIRGADSDTLKTLSEQLDAIQADLNNPDQYKADVSGLSTFDPTSDEVDVGKVKGVGVASVDDFKADVSGLSTFDPATDEVDVGEVKGVAVSSVDDFKADVSGLSTFDSTTDEVDIGSVKGVAVSSVDDFKANVSSIAADAADAVWNEAFADHTTSTSFGYVVGKLLRSQVVGKWVQSSQQWIKYDPDDGVTPLVTFDTKNAAGSGADVDIYERDPV